MQVFRSIQEFKKLERATVTSGTFDGVHLGHRKILSGLKEIAGKAQSPSVVITFWPHPRMVLSPQSETRLLTTLEEKINLLAEENPDYLLVIPFTIEFANLSSMDFIQQILINTIGTTQLVIGYDHRFGKNREGSFVYLKEHSAELGFEVIEIPREDIENITVSSTNIRNALAEGNVEKAEILLGRPYFISGRVIQGDKLGRTLGFPTANILPEDDHKILPGNGVYAVTVEFAGTLYQGMLNIGVRPTVGGKRKVIEVNIFDFDEDIYGSTIKINFIRFLRQEQKFSSLEALKEQLFKDKKQSQKILSNSIRN